MIKEFSPETEQLVALYNKAAASVLAPLYVLC